MKKNYLWEVHPVYEGGTKVDDRYDAYIDISHSHGILHFTREISIVFDFKDNELTFLSASEIACSDCDYDTESDFEFVHPGMLEDLKQYMVSQGTGNVGLSKKEVQ